MRRHLHRVAFTLVGLGLATLSCQILAGLEEPVGVDLDAAADTGSVTPPGPAACGVRVPPRPSANDDKDLLTKHAYWLAAQEMRSVNDGGFDLDETCTCQAEGEADVPSCGTAKVACDGPRGVDDALGTLFAKFTAGGVNPLDDVSSSFRDGRRGLLLFIGDYNDTDTDSDVTVQFVSSSGLYSNLDCDGAARDAAPSPPNFYEDAASFPNSARYKPLFDGCDEFSVTTGSTLPAAEGRRTPDRPLTGYVVQNQLVVQFPLLGASIFGERSNLANGFGLATLSRENGRLRADGVLGGRLEVDSLLTVIGRSEVKGVPVCKGTLWPFVQNSLCEARDIRAKQVEDFKNLPCDAVSIAVGFVLRESRVAAEEYNRPVEINDCDAATCQ